MPAPRRVAVAASGGRDSTALLHCTVRTAAAEGIEVVALHVHHGLQPAADGWLQQVRRQSARWGAGFEATRLATAPGPGESIEAWARRERYRALAAMAGAAGCPLVLLAHHRRDQAETWLLQALRGGGAAGLSAMPAQAERGGVVWARPWLGMPRSAIEAYVRRHQLQHVDDDSNDDPRYARNRLRLQVWPALGAAFPDAEPSLVRAATQAQHAAALAAEIAQMDLPPLLQGRALQVAPWLALPPARRRNALRAWLAQTLGRGSPESLLDRLLDELPRLRSARWDAPGSQLQLHRGLLQCPTTAPSPPPLHPPPPAAAGPRATFDLSQPGHWPLPEWGGRYTTQVTDSHGAAPVLLRQLTARPRAGGERFRLAPRAAARSLKLQYQARGIPAWQRAGPLLYTADGQLLFVPGLGIDAALQAAPGEPQLGLAWEADAAPTAAPPKTTGRRQPAS